MKALVLLLPFSVLSAGCHPPAAPVSPPPAERGADEKREDNRDPVDVILGAKRAVTEGRFEEAYRDLVWAFDRGPIVRSTVSPAIATSVPDLLALLGKKYPPALAALRERKDRLEATLRAGLPGSIDDVFFYEHSARALGQVGDAVETCKRMPRPAAGDRRRRVLCGTLLDELLDAGMWEEAADHAESLFVSISVYHMIPHGHPGKPDAALELARRGARLLGAMLRLKRDEQALDFAQRVLDKLPKAVAYDEMIDAARAAGREALAEQLARQASSRLERDELQRLKQPRPSMSP